MKMKIKNVMRKTKSGVTKSKELNNEVHTGTSGLCAIWGMVVCENNGRMQKQNRKENHFIRNYYLYGVNFWNGNIFLSYLKHSQTDIHKMHRLHQWGSEDRELGRNLWNQCREKYLRESVTLFVFYVTHFLSQGDASLLLVWDIYDRFLF